MKSVRDSLLIILAAVLLCATVPLVQAETLNPSQRRDHTAEAVRRHNNRAVGLLQPCVDRRLGFVESSQRSVAIARVHVSVPRIRLQANCFDGPCHPVVTVPYVLAFRQKYTTNPAL
jgi:hypothetical protein